MADHEPREGAGSKTDTKRKTGRPRDPERAQQGEDVHVIRTFLPGVVADALVKRSRWGEADKVEVLLKEFVLVKNRVAARRLARELADLVAAYPEMESGEAPAPERSAGYEAARLRVRAGLHALEQMLNPQPVAAMAYREVAGVERPGPAPLTTQERLDKSKIDVVKHAAHEQRGLWDAVKADRDARFKEDDDD